MANDADEAADRRGEEHLAAARTNFRPIEQFLGHLDGAVVRARPGSYALTLTEAMRRSAINACDVLYTLRGAGEETLSLRFTMVGDRADMLLFQAHQSSVFSGAQPKSGPVDQHVYRMGEVEELKRVVERRVTAFLA